MPFYDVLFGLVTYIIHQNKGIVFIFGTKTLENNGFLRDFYMGSMRSYKSIDELEASILRFIEQYNLMAKPFKWTYKGVPLLA